MELSEKLLETSKSDLETTKILFKHAKYAEAVFHFQQSVEKSNKALMLFLKNVTEKELKGKISHHPIKMYENIFDKYDKISDQFKSMRLKFPSLYNTPKIIDVEKYSNDLKLLKKTISIEKSKNLTSKTIARAIKNIRNSFLKYNKSPKQIDVNITQEKIIEKIEQFEIEFFKMCDSMIKESSELQKDLKDMFARLKSIDWECNKIEKAIVMICSLAFRLHPILISNLYLSIIVNEHAVISRYPDVYGIPQEKYISNNPLIERLPSLIYFQSKTIALCDEIFQN